MSRNIVAYFFGAKSSSFCFVPVTEIMSSQKTKNTSARLPSRMWRPKPWVFLPFGDSYRVKKQGGWRGKEGG